MCSILIVCAKFDVKKENLYGLSWEGLVEWNLQRIISKESVVFGAKNYSVNILVKKKFLKWKEQKVENDVLHTYLDGDIFICTKSLF